MLSPELGPRSTLSSPMAIQERASSPNGSAFLVTL